MPPPPKRRHVWIVTLLLICGALAGIGVAVRADREGAPAVRPYDPLPRW